MRLLIIYLLSFLLAKSMDSGATPAPLRSESNVFTKVIVANWTNNFNPGTGYPRKANFALTLIGYISASSGGFSAESGCGLTTTTAVYSLSRQFGQITSGDTLRNAAGDILTGGGQGYGFSPFNGVAAKTGIKLGGGVPGVVDGMGICATGAQEIYYFNSSGANCGQTSFPGTNIIYGDETMPGLWNGRVLYDQTLGGLLDNGTYTVSKTVNGTAVYTFTIASGNGRVTSLAVCTTVPIVNAGADFSVSLPSPTINLAASAFDPDSENPLTYQWTQQSGPNTATITTPTSLTTSITGVVAGTYVFRMTATDASSEQGQDEISVLVQSAALCATPTLFPMLPRMVWDLSGTSGEAAQRLMDTLGTRKFPSVLGAGFVAFDRGDANPKDGQFDFNLSLPGVQGDTTTPMMTRASIHAGNTYPGGVQNLPSLFHLGNGNQRVIFVDFERVMYWDQLWWIDSTGTSISNAAEIIITNSVAEVRNAVFQFRTGVVPTIDYVLNAATVSGYKSILNMRDTGQYMIIRFNPVFNSPPQGPNFKSFFPYGCVSTFNTSSSQITPNYAAAIPPRDTTQPVQFHAGRVIATPIPLITDYLKDTFPFSSKKLGGYLLSVDTAAANGGSSDTSLAPFNIANANIKWYQAMYGDINLFMDSTLRVNGVNEEYMVVGQPSRRLLKQIFELPPYLGSTPIRSMQHIPIDSFGCDVRLQSSYGRYTYNFMMNKAVLGFTAPSVTSSYAPYLTESRIAGNPFPGRGLAWGRKEWIIPYNENNLDFRPGNTPTTAGSSWMPPVAFWAFHDTLYKIFKETFPTDKFVLQGLAAWEVETFLQAEQLGRIWYMDKVHPICDIINLHTVVVKNVHDINKGCQGNIGQQSVFPGQRNETAKFQAFLDTVALITGSWRNAFVTEYSVASNTGFQLPITGCDYNVLSVSPLKSYNPFEVQGILKLQDRIAYERVRGIYRSWQYEAFDLVDEASPFYNGNDGSQGDVNTTGGQPFNYKAGHFIDQQHSKWLNNYRVWRTDADTVNGTLIVLYRNVVNRDSFCTVVTYQDYVDRPGGAISIPLFTDVTTTQKKSHLWPDWTYNGSTSSPTVTSGNVTHTPRPEVDYFFYQSTGLSALLDGAPPASQLRWKGAKVKFKT